MRRLWGTVEVAVGSRVQVEEQGRTYVGVVSRTYEDQSASCYREKTVVWHIRPGGYVGTFDAEDIRSSRVIVHVLGAEDGVAL